MNPLVILYFCLCLTCGYGRNDEHQSVIELSKNEALEYPGHNKENGAKIDALWKQYYKCINDNYHSSLRKEHTASSLMALKGQSVTLPCLSMCKRPRRSGFAIWFRKKRASDKVATEIDYTNKMVLHENGSLHIYQTSEEDDAVYYCKRGASDGGVVFLEITDDEEPLLTTTVEVSKGASTTRLAEHPLELYTRWYPWTACSSCTEIGIRHQTGICYIKHRIPYDASSLYTNDKTDYTILKVFAEGLPCRSKYLPDEIEEIAEVKSRKSEIVTASCKVICNVGTAAMNNVTVNENSTIFHNFQQSYYTNSPAREVLFVGQGERVKLSCPRHSLTDVTVRWRIGTSGQFLAESTGETAKVMVNAREQIIINNINTSAENIYSCWQLEELTGIVRIDVKMLHRYDFDSIVTIASLCIISAVFSLCIGRMVRMKFIQQRKTSTSADV